MLSRCVRPPGGEQREKGVAEDADKQNAPKIRSIFLLNYALVEGKIKL